MAAAKHEIEIDVPEHLTRAERARDTLVTGVLWAVYLYLWVPLASLLAWLLGVELAYDVMIRSGGARGLLDELAGYGLVVLGIFGVVTAWSFGNRLRFRGRDRRDAARRRGVTDADIASYFNVAETQLKQLRSGRRLDIRFRDEEPTGSSIAVEPRD